ncbi:MAG: MobF family relaxase [Acidimicrobiales bacterium]
MLTVTGLSNAEYLISSVALSIDEYYAGLGESPGVWAGQWAEGLGLSDVVEADQLRALVDGKHPNTGVDLLAGTRSRSVLAFDLTFSAPKSVSLLWALGSEPIADAVAAAHREATEVALGFLEERAAVARVQAQKVRRRVSTGGWAVAGFVHRTSREGDPQLHTHCLVPNLVQRADGRHVAVDAGPLFEWARAAGSIYQNHLQRTLTMELGVVWGQDRNNTREMEGFTRSQLRAFSKRSAQIEAELEAKGAMYESPALRMQADDEASLATRSPKDHSLTPSLLAGRWEREAEQVGLAVRTELDRAVRRGGPVLDRLGWEQMTATLVDPELGLCSRSARFTKADVVEHLCAISGGRLSVEDITVAAERFVNSELAVRLTPDNEAGRRRAAEWSTAAHRALEDRTLALMDTLASRSPTAIGSAAVEAALEAAPGLGEDQVAAVRVLAGEGGGLRAVLAPAGYGKTTMLHAAARAVSLDGRPVVAVATTAKAVAELSGAGLDSRTIARLRIDLSDGPLAAGTVVVLDEISQTPTAEVEAVLAAVDACPGGSIWVLGDPRQSQPVGAGGTADHIEQLATAGRIPSARLTVNRRQVDAADREALDLLRHGDPFASQQLRAEHGWEHEHGSPAETRQAMAHAVSDDIANCGADQVAALVVSHGDAEDLADRIRTRLADAGLLGGPAMTGPGWTGERDYRAGDRVLLHARCGPGGSRLVNGTTATLTRVEPAGLTVRLDGGKEDQLLPAAFVSGVRKDGAPNLSHAWARPVDGAKGGTWEACHLLGSSALDAYRGYTGQSRSRRPTHTWNTTRVTVVDHGGILADQRDPAEQVADALRHRPDPSLAARSDPWVPDRLLRQQIAEHEEVLSRRPPDRKDALAAATEDLRSARSQLALVETSAARSAAELEAFGVLSGLSRRGREQRQLVTDRLQSDRRRAAATQDRYDEVAVRVERLHDEQEALRRFESAEGWRRGDLIRLHDHLDHHWAKVVTACVGADDPLAYGIDKLRHARATLTDDRRAIDAAIPEDRADQWQQVRRQLASVVKQCQDAKRILADSEAQLQDAGRRRWGRHDHEAIASAQENVAAGERRVQQVLGAERDLRDRLAALAGHQQRRQQHIADVSAECRELDATVAQIDAALESTRADRVAVLADDPPDHLVQRIGAAPDTPAGKAVWCHHALDIEATIDRSGGRIPAWIGWSPQNDWVRRQIAVADRLLESSNDLAGPAQWAELAQQAGAVLDEMRRVERNRATRQKMTRRQGPQPTPGNGPAAEGPRRGISL